MEREHILSNINSHYLHCSLSRETLLGVWVLCLILLMPSLCAAKDDSNSQRWTFAPEVGFEGEAAVSDGKSSRMEMECGNGGGPAMEVESPAIKQISFKGRDELYLLHFDIDGNRITEKYHCYPKNSVCISFGFPSVKLTSALRQGLSLVVRFEDSILATLPLSGSNAAISQLSSCLGPEVY